MEHTTLPCSQEIVVKPICDEIIIKRRNEEVFTNNKVRKVEQIIRKGAELANCPRCNSNNTKFCYYNNYSLTQPRFFCKTCRRYWTQGGTLRNVPVGGASRKNKTKSSSSSNSKLPNQLQNPNPGPTVSSPINLGFPILSSGYKSFSDLISMPNFEDKSSAGSALTGLSRPVDNFCLPPTSTSSGFCLDGYGINSSSITVEESSSGGISRRVLFPFEDLNKVYTTSNFDDQNNHNTGDAAGIYWNGAALGGGESW